MAFLMLAVGLLSLFIVGFPLTYIIFKNKANEPFSRVGIWALSPFTGYALISGILKLLVSFDIPIKYSAYPFLAIFLIIFIVFCVWAHKKKYKIAPALPFSILTALTSILYSLSYFVIGAKYYRGFGWWDLFFYGSQAEFLKESAFSSLEALCETQPYVGAIYWYFNGCHRISRGTVQAFVSAICGTDGASSLGFISIASIVLVFCALIYATSDLKIKPLYKYLASFFGATIPLVIMTEMEGFVPVCLFMSFAAVFCKIFLDAFEDCSLVKAVFAGTLTASFISTLLDATYLFAGIIAISCFYSMIKHKRFLKPLLSSVVIGLVAILWNIPFLKEFLRELGGSMSRQGLNGIFPFAYTQKVLNFTFYGTTLESADGLFFLLLRFATIVMLILGVSGTIMYFLKKHNGEILNFLAIIVLPTVFMCFGEDYSYSFYKLYSLAVPLLIVGIWLFWIVAREEFKKVTANLDIKWAKQFKSIVLKGGTVVLALFFVACNLCSVIRSLWPITVNGNYRGDIVYLKCFSPEWIDLYDELSSTTDENILIVTGENELGFWWSTYFGRYNNIYSLTNEMDDTYFKYEDFDRTDINKLPLDCQIVLLPNTDNAVSPESARDDVATILQYKSNHDQTKFTSRRNFGETAAVEFKFPIYAKSDGKATLNINIKSFEANEPIPFTIDGVEYTATSEAQNISIELNLKAGANSCTIKTNSEQSKLMLNSWELICNY